MNSITRRDFVRDAAPPNRFRQCLISKRLPMLTHLLHTEYEPADEVDVIARNFAFLRTQVDAAYGGVS